MTLRSRSGMYSIEKHRYYPYTPRNQTPGVISSQLRVPEVTGSKKKIKKYNMILIDRKLPKTHRKHQNIFANIFHLFGLDLVFLRVCTKVTRNQLRRQIVDLYELVSTKQWPWPCTRVQRLTSWTQKPWPCVTSGEIFVTKNFVFWENFAIILGQSQGQDQ